MTLSFFAEQDPGFPFDPENAAALVAKKTLELLSVTQEAEVSVTITGPEEIRKLNSDFRGIDSETDVLSFPMIECSVPGRLPEPSSYASDLNPDTKELPLGDIVINAERVRTQAEEYGHGLLREYAFLLTHSMLHLLGFDHENEEEEKEMFAWQEKILLALDISRDL
jgi:metalloprotein, YbeY/UPF0054 family